MILSLEDFQHIYLYGVKRYVWSYVVAAQAQTNDPESEAIKFIKAVSLSDVHLTSVIISNDKGSLKYIGWSEAYAQKHLQGATDMEVARSFGYSDPKALAGLVGLHIIKVSLR